MPSDAVPLIRVHTQHVSPTCSVTTSLLDRSVHSLSLSLLLSKLPQRNCVTAHQQTNKKNAHAFDRALGSLTKAVLYNHTSLTFTPCVCFAASAVAKDWRRRSLVPQLVASVSVTLIVVVERHEHHRQQRLIVTLIVGAFVCLILLCLKPTA